MINWNDWPQWLAFAYIAYFVGRAADDVRRMRQMTEELLQHARNSPGVPPAG